MTPKSCRSGGLLRRYFVAGVFASLAAISALAHTENESTNMKVNTKGTDVTWVSGPKFDRMARGQKIRIGSDWCTVKEMKKETSLICKESLGNHTAVTADLYEDVTVTLLASQTHTSDTAAQQDKYLAVAASGAAEFEKAKSWLYFNASALPDGIKDADFTNVQLQLVPKAKYEKKELINRKPQTVLVREKGADRGMTITVVPQRASPDGREPLLYSAGTVVTWVSGPKFDKAGVGQKVLIGSDPCTVVTKTSDTSLTCGEDLEKQSGVTANFTGGKVNTSPIRPNTLRSPPLPTGELMQLRSDSASLTRGSLLQSDGGRRYIGLLLLPQGNASRRVYYGLNTSDMENDPDRLPRLVITYRRMSPAVPACSSQPSALALMQSDGRPAATSSCNFIRTNSNPPQNYYSPMQVAAGTLTKTPVVYGDRLYVVRKEGSETRLEELSSFGAYMASVPFPLTDEVREGSPMVVDSFGRLRIITNNAIFTAQLALDPNLVKHLPASLDRKSFTFNELPKTVLPGPDGTLYIVKQGIFALNPQVGELDTEGKVVRPQKLWQVSIHDEEYARITLTPDGRFLYALAQVGDPPRSRFIAINAQTGNDVQLLPGKVNTSGTQVTWASGPEFDSTAKGEKIRIGYDRCTVEEIKSLKSLICKVDLGKQSGVTVDLPGGKVDTSGTDVTWISGSKFDSTEAGQKIDIGSRLCTVETKASDTSLTCKEGLGKQSGVPANFPAAEGFELLPANVNTSGTVVTWVSGSKFESMAAGRKIGIGSRLCTIETKASDTSLTCKEGLGKQSGVTADFPAGKVNTLGTEVTWVSGPKFESTAVGEKIWIGSDLCTVEAKTGDQSLTCKAGLGEQAGVTWADFPDDLNRYRNPVVASDLEEGVDFVYITGNSGSGATLWGVKNDPVTEYGNLFARLTRVWEYPLEERSEVGQPILNPTATAGLSKKKLYFLQSSVAGSKLTAVNALDGKEVAPAPPQTALPANISTDGNPVVDSAGNFMFWADDTFYGFTGEPKLLFNQKLPELGKPQLLFGPRGMLYAGSGATVRALIPSFNLDTVGNIRKIESPTNLQVTGTATGGAPWELEARGGVILGNGFQVRNGATLSVTVNKSQ
jgi:hypothetical protein